MSSTLTERMRVVELSPPTQYTTVADHDGRPHAMIRGRRPTFSFILSATPDGSSAAQFGVEMSMDGVVWVRSIVMPTILDSSPLITHYSKINLTAAQAQQDSGTSVANENEYDWGMAWVRSWFRVVIYSGPGAFTMSFHMAH